MGAGLALSIAKRWPVVKTQYKEAFATGALQLGTVLVVPLKSGLSVACICGQEDYGRENKVYTHYPALREGLVRVNTLPFKEVYIPYMIGCGLAGGNWEAVKYIIYQEVSRATIVRLGKL